jgi:hypothetical protein
MAGVGVMDYSAISTSRSRALRILLQFCPEDMIALVNARITQEEKAEEEMIDVVDIKESPPKLIEGPSSVSEILPFEEK